MNGQSPPSMHANHHLKEEIRAYWSKRAETFDLQTGHRIEDGAEAPAWQALFRRRLGPLEGRKVLDLACGTGEISRMLLAMGAEVTGVDFAEPMLSRAIAKNGDARNGKQAFRGRLADVETLITEPDCAYDAIVTRHLVWTLTDPHQAFANWFRVLKPGGRLLAVDGDWVKVGPLGRLMKFIATGRMHGNSGDAALHENLLAAVHYAEGLTAERLAADLGRHGFGEIETHSMAGIYLWGMRRAPFRERLRLMSARRYAVSAVKPAGRARP